MSEGNGGIVFCEGCGARLDPHDRTCPKCGRPAPGILSSSSAASDLAAGKTASFPRLSFDDDVDAKSPSAPQILTESLDPEATGVIDASRVPGARRAPRPARRRGNVRMDPDDGYGRPHRGRWIAVALLLVLAGCGAWFVAADPLGIMPGVYDRIGDAASDMFPSRQTADGGSAAAKADADDADDGDSTDDPASVSEQSISDAEAYQRLSALYGRILQFQGDLGPVIDDFNAWFKASDLGKRQEASKSAYSMRDDVQGVIDELDSLKLSDGSAYAEDVDHLRQLATWMCNRVDVLCRSWDISLTYKGDSDADKPYRHADEILAPLREIEMENGKSVDVARFESHVNEWQPQQK